MFLCDNDIRALCVNEDGVPLDNPLLTPFVEECPDGVISYGISAGGYDIRLADDEFKLFRSARGQVIDPKKFRSQSYAEEIFETIYAKDGKVTIPPNSYILGRSYEFFRIPANLIGIAVGKSTYARCGLIANITPLEPMWKGYLTIEISNDASAPAEVYVMEGICQILFGQLSGIPKRTYATKRGGRGGVYQGQIGVTPPRVSDV